MPFSFKYAESETDAVEVNNHWKAILSTKLDETESLATLLEGTNNRKFVLCFDEARGLFGKEGVLDDRHSLVFRGIRRASIRIMESLQHIQGAKSVFIYMDTNSAVTNFISPKDTNWSATSA